MLIIKNNVIKATGYNYIYGILIAGNEFEVSGSGYNDNGKVICNDETYLNEVTQIALMGKLNNESKF